MSISKILICFRTIATGQRAIAHTSRGTDMEKKHAGHELVVRHSYKKLGTTNGENRCLF
jgi:hypothetical protein